MRTHLSILTLLLWACGCYSPAVLHGPRTLEPGALELQVGVLAGALPADPLPEQQEPTSFICQESWGGGCGKGRYVGPGDVRLGLRAGLADRLELGVALSPLPGAEVDVLVQIVRSRAFDLAIDPTVYVGAFPLVERSEREVTVAARAPLILGLNLSEAHTAIVYGGPASIPTRHDERLQMEVGIGWAMRTAGAQFVPTVGWFRSLDGSDDLRFFAGLGISALLEGDRDYAGAGF